MKQQTVDNLSSLGQFFSEVLDGQENSEIHKEAIELVSTVHRFNPWFTEDFVRHSFSAWSKALRRDNVEDWLHRYELDEQGEAKRIGVIMAGNIPLVGLHDAISVLAAGHILQAKLSTKDSHLTSLVLRYLSSLSEDWASRIEIADKLNQADRIIATGSDNSARYFEYYFRETPKIIRKNRTSIAIVSEDVEQGQLDGLSDDVFTYFGLGCRNVTKVYVPEGFDLDRLFQSFYKYKDLINHHQYANNYDYNKAVYLMNKVELIENGFLLLKEDEGLHSPLGVLFYEYYTDLEALQNQLEVQKDQIQLSVSDLEGFKNLGDAQSPELWDYADNVDTLNFLLKG